MAKAIGVQFVSGIKAYDFNPGEYAVKIGDLVLVETIQGKEVGKVVYKEKEINEKKLTNPLKEIIKVLDEAELERIKNNKKRSKEDYERISKLITRLKVPIRPLHIEYSIFEDRVDIFFAAEGRVDFRNAVRDISRTLNKTVRLRQVGSRDQAKLLGGFGPCGREICCKRFLLTAGGISKEDVQTMTGSKNISKLLGVCGNILCCLNYEGKKAKEVKKEMGEMTNISEEEIITKEENIKKEK